MPLGPTPIILPQRQQQNPFLDMLTWAAKMVVTQTFRERELKMQKDAADALKTQAETVDLIKAGFTTQAPPGPQEAAGVATPAVSDASEVQKQPTIEQPTIPSGMIGKGAPAFWSPKLKATNITAGGRDFTLVQMGDKFQIHEAAKPTVDEILFKQMGITKGPDGYYKVGLDENGGPTLKPLGEPGIVYPHAFTNDKGDVTMPAFTKKGEPVPEKNRVYPGAGKTKTEPEGSTPSWQQKFELHDEGGKSVAYIYDYNPKTQERRFVKKFPVPKNVNIMQLISGEMAGLGEPGVSPTGSPVEASPTSNNPLGW